MSLKDTIRFSGTIAGLKVEGRFTVEGLKQVGRFDNGTTPPATLPPLSLIYDGHGENAPVNKAGVYAVENLNGSGAGSLFAAPADRFVIFPNLSGDITLSAQTPFSTTDLHVLGQTGDIQIRGDSTVTTQPLINFSSSRTILSHLRFSAGALPNSNSNHSAFDILGGTVRDVVINKCSFRLGQDNVASMWNDVQNVSWLDCLFAYGTGNTSSSTANYPLLIGGGTENVTIARCLLNGKDRTSTQQNTRGIDYRNNVVYYQSNGPAFQHVDGKPFSHPLDFTANCTDNLFIRTNNGSTSDINFHLRNTDPANPTMTLQVFVDNNYRMFRGGDPTAAVAALTSIYGGASGDSSNPNDFITGTAFPNPPFSVLDPRTELFNHVMSNAGASHNRDAMDASVINEVSTGAVPNTTNTIAGFGGYPTLSGISVPDIWDLSAVDKLSDAVKAKYGIAAGTDTTDLPSSINGGTSCDFLAILNAEGIL